MEENKESLAQGQTHKNTSSSNEEDFEFACSDEELSMKDGVEWEPSPEEIAQLLEDVDRKKVLELDWKCPERRPLTPVDNFDQQIFEEGNAQDFEGKSGFDFEDESSPMKLSVRPLGSEVGPRGSAKRKITNLDDILSNMARHRKMDMMEDDDDALPFLRKVKMDQRKLMDNANTITDMAKTQNTVYEIVSDMSSRYDSLEERLLGLEDKLVNIQEQVELLPELINRVLAQHQQAAITNKELSNANNNSITNSTDRSNERRNFLHPESAANPIAVLSPLLSHSRSVPTTASQNMYHWPASPILPPISSRTPHLVPEPLLPNS